MYGKMRKEKKLIMEINGKKITEISQKDLMELLKDEENTFVFGPMGSGKSSIVKEYAETTGKTLLTFSLATMIPEFIGGVPYAKVTADSKTEYFALLLNEQLQPLFECKGKNYILFFDEMNQAVTEVMNCLYSICHIDPKQRNWCGHSLEYAQIVGAGNLSDGTDSTVYLNELPGPLLDRFFVYELVPQASNIRNFLKNKYKNIPQVAKYIDVMLEEKINARDIDKCLEMLQFNRNPLRLRAKLGTALTQKILDLQKDIESIDPAKILTNARNVYKRFKEYGEVQLLDMCITTEEELIKAFKTMLSDEEIESIVKGSEE